MEFRTCEESIHANKRHTHTAMVKVSNVSKSFDANGPSAVSKVSFDLAEGECLVLLGSSGCGKSTLLRLINRLLIPDEGRIQIKGNPIENYPVIELRRSIGYVIQDVGLFPHWSVEENVASPLRIRRVPRLERLKAAGELLARVGLAPKAFAKRYPHELSGGQAQRVGVARALANQPSILLMDEPFSALDGVTREQLQEVLIELKTSLKKTILFVTHDLFEALTLGDRIAIMHEGKFEQIGSKSEILQNPATPFVKQLFSKPARQLDLYIRHTKDASE